MSYTKAERFYNAGRFAKSRDMLARMVKQSPNDVRALTLLGYCHDQIGHLRKPKDKLACFKKAREAFRGVAALGDEVRSLHGLGTVALHAGRHAEAYRLYRRAYAISSDLNLCLSIGNAQRHRGNYANAIRWYMKYARAYPKSWQAWTNIALTYRDANDLNMARDAAKKAVSLFPKKRKGLLERIRNKMRKI